MSMVWARFRVWIRFSANSHLHHSSQLAVLKCENLCFDFTLAILRCDYLCFHSTLAIPRQYHLFFHSLLAILSCKHVRFHSPFAIIVCEHPIFHYLFSILSCESLIFRSPLAILGCECTCFHYLFFILKCEYPIFHSLSDILSYNRLLFHSLLPILSYQDLFFNSILAILSCKKLSWCFSCSRGTTQHLHLVAGISTRVVRHELARCNLTPHYRSHRFESLSRCSFSVFLPFIFHYGFYSFLVALMIQDCLSISERRDCHIFEHEGFNNNKEDQGERRHNVCSAYCFNSYRGSRQCQYIDDHTIQEHEQEHAKIPIFNYHNNNRRLSFKRGPISSDSVPKSKCSRSTSTSDFSTTISTYVSKQKKCSSIL